MMPLQPHYAVPLSLSLNHLVFAFFKQGKEEEEEKKRGLHESSLVF